MRESFEIERLEEDKQLLLEKVARIRGLIQHKSQWRDSDAFADCWQELKELESLVVRSGVVIV